MSVQADQDLYFAEEPCIVVSADMAARGQGWSLGLILRRPALQKDNEGNGVARHGGCYVPHSCS